jgi:hypothetical protein
MVRRLPVLAALALAACNTNFAPQYLVHDLRILAAQAVVLDQRDPDEADADAGDTVRLTVLVANPENLPGLTVRWKACLPSQAQAVSPCLDPAVLRDPSRLDQDPSVVDLGEGESVTVTVPPALAPLLQTLIDRSTTQPGLACTMYEDLPVLITASAGGTTRTALKTVRLTPYREVPATLDGAYIRNENPGIDSVLAEPVDADACDGGVRVMKPCSSNSQCGTTQCVIEAGSSGSAPGHCADPLGPGLHTLCVKPSDRAVQVYQQCAEDGTKTQFFESLSYQWYTTGGTLKRSGSSPPGDTGNITGTPVTLEAPDGPFTLWMIVRDGRGGEDWIRRDYP